MSSRTTSSRVLFYLFSSFSLIGCIAYVLCTLLPAVAMNPLIHVICLAFLFFFIYISGRFYSADMPKEDKARVMHRTFVCLLVLYSFTVISLTLFDGSMGRTGFESIEKWKNINSTELEKHLNLVPFKTLSRFFMGIFNKNYSSYSIIINLLGNAVIFMPFACLLPAVFSRLSRFWVFLLTMVCAVSVIELLQLVLLTGCCDIDDLILNVFGALSAYAFFGIPIIKKGVKRLSLF